MSRSNSLDLGFWNIARMYWFHIYDRKRFLSLCGVVVTIWWFFQFQAMTSIVLHRCWKSYLDWKILLCAFLCIIHITTKKQIKCFFILRIVVHRSKPSLLMQPDGMVSSMYYDSFVEYIKTYLFNFHHTTKSKNEQGK